MPTLGQKPSKKDMTISIYALYYYDKTPPVKRFYYVGRSNNVPRRLKEHKFAKNKGSEDKYEFIRELESNGIDWENHEILREIPEGEYPPDNERWFII